LSGGPGWGEGSRGGGSRGRGERGLGASEGSGRRGGRERAAARPLRVLTCSRCSGRPPTAISHMATVTSSRVPNWASEWRLRAMKAGRGGGRSHRGGRCGRGGRGGRGGEQWLSGSAADSVSG
jgi:hypothetical protein